MLYITCQIYGLNTGADQQGHVWPCAANCSSLSTSVTNFAASNRSWVLFGNLCRFVSSTCQSLPLTVTSCHRDNIPPHALSFVPLTAYSDTGRRQVSHNTPPNNTIHHRLHLTTETLTSPTQHSRRQRDERTCHSVAVTRHTEQQETTTAASVN